jgi:hypothetical protein
VHTKAVTIRSKATTKSTALGSPDTLMCLI